MLVLSVALKWPKVVHLSSFPPRVCRYVLVAMVMKRDFIMAMERALDEDNENIGVRLRLCSYLLAAHHV